MQSKVITSKLHPNINFISQINTVHEYTETESKYMGKFGKHSL